MKKVELTVSDRLLSDIAHTANNLSNHDEELGDFYKNVSIMLEELDVYFDNEFKMLEHLCLMFKAHTGYTALLIFEENNVYIYSNHPLFSEDDYYTQIRIFNYNNEIYEIICEV